jgi:hypothetical protein
MYNINITTSKTAKILKSFSTVAAVCAHIAYGHSARHSMCHVTLLDFTK